MTNRKIDWGSYKPMTEIEKEAADKQQYAFTCLVVISCFNIMFGILMVYKIIPVWLGMIFAFFVMGIIILKARNRLLDEGETLSESANQFHTRRSQKNS